MSNISVFNFDSQEIRFVDGKPVANDVAKVLGYADPSKTVSTKVDAENKGVTRLATPGGMQSVTVLKEAGIYQLVSRSRMPNAKLIAQQLNLYVLNCAHEQETVRILEVAFADLQPIRQFSVHGYRIDLYLAKANIAIECDENNHSQYKNDKKRESIIKSALGCSFVRYNPSNVGFNIGEVILKVRQLTS
jgi:very-short-patch-repair endonuclease